MAKQHELSLVFARTIREELIYIPGIRANRLKITDTVGTLPLCHFQSISEGKNAYYSDRHLPFF
jgi:hypothetical protein